MRFLTRRLGPADASSYRELRLAGLRDEPTAFGSTYEDEVGRTLDETAERLGKNFSFGVFDAEGLAGIATFYVEALLKTRHRGHIVGVYVLPRVRGTGAATALFESLIGVARQEVLQLHLVVTQKNERARRFYERFGFAIYGNDPRGLRVDGVFYDDYLMMLRLDGGSGK